MVYENDWNGCSTRCHFNVSWETYRGRISFQINNDVTGDTGLCSANMRCDSVKSTFHWCNSCYKYPSGRHTPSSCLLSQKIQLLCKRTWLYTYVNKEKECSKERVCCLFKLANTLKCDRQTEEKWSLCTSRAMQATQHIHRMINLSVDADLSDQSTEHHPSKISVISRPGQGKIATSKLQWGPIINAQWWEIIGFCFWQRGKQSSLHFI